MSKKFFIFIVICSIAICCFFTNLLGSTSIKANNLEDKNVELGQFSVSLSVKDIKVSRAFYEKLGFKIIAGQEDRKWLILKNGNAVIGLFQGQFDKNTLTFNPTDVRSVQKELKTKGVEFKREVDETTKGPDYSFLFDPDGNPILFDQHNQ